MRDIKFRAYDKYKKEMHIVSEMNWNIFSEEVKLIATGYNDNSCLAYNKNHSSEKCDITALNLMQYTGLKDKNGKEIYEGDIVKSYFENGLGAENKCLIIYDEYLCAFMGQELTTKQQYLFNEGNPNKKDKQLKYTEVIGNIYDNPELLEEGE